MQQVTERHELDNEGNETASSQVTRTESSAKTPGTVLAARIVRYVGGVLIVLLAIRFVLILLGANPASGFVNFIYTLTYPLAVPFFGVVGYDVQYGVSRVEWASLIAMAIYALVAYGIARLLTINRAD